MLFIGLAAGAVIAYFVYGAFAKAKKKENASEQSVVLMERIRSVCKFITVEGDFSEIYHYENVKDKVLNLLLGKKKAIVLITAKAHIGFDLTQIRMDSNPERKTILLNNFPQPEIMSIETDFKFYDKKEGWANYFTSDDLTDVNQKAKQHIIDKVPDSGLIEQARTEAMETIKLMEKLTETIGWKLDYSALVLETEGKTPRLEDSTSQD